MKRIISVIAFALVALGMSAQSSTKLDPALFSIMHENQVEQSARENVLAGQTATGEKLVVNAVLRDGATLPLEQLKDHGIQVEDQYECFLTLTVPTSQLAALDSLEAFESFQLDQEYETDNMLSQNTMLVNKIQSSDEAQAEGLPQTYTGRGVIVGVFDNGIDFNHNNFRNPQTHKTRVLGAAIYKKGQATPIAKAFGSDIDAFTTDNYGESHGTHTSSTAAGSYEGRYADATGSGGYAQMKGIAHEADLVLCGDPNLRLAHQKNALRMMDSIATAHNEPLVVNLSIGCTGDWLDGKEAVNKFYDKFTQNGDKPGRIVCVSAGNNGNKDFTIYKELNASNNHTIRSFIPMVKTADKQGWVFGPKILIYCSDTTAVHIALEKYDKNYNYQKTIPESDLTAVVAGSRHSDHDNRYCKTYNNGDKYRTYGGEAGQHWAVKITSETDTKIRAFVYNKNQSTGRYFVSYFDDCSREGFTDGTPRSSINTMANTNSVLSVGAWQVTKGFYDWNGVRDTVSYKSKNDYIAQFSSWVRSDDNGVGRPDFAAPGVAIVSGYNCYDSTEWKNNAPVNVKRCIGKATDEYMAGHTSLLGVMSGTSMSCPNSAGVIALLLQADPTLTVNKLRRIISETADKDAMTEQQSARFGAGKLNALKALKKVLQEKATGIMDLDSEDPQPTQPRKIIRNGHIYIQRGTDLYDLTGRQL